MKRTKLGRVLVALALSGACGSSPTTPTDSPTVTCPSDITVQSLDGSALTVAYTTPTAVGGSAPVTVSCSPLSGATFAPGATTVTCTATDTRGRSGACSFAVRVTVPPRLRATNFLAFGDSMTEGTVSAPAPSYRLLTTSESYPSQLHPMLTARYVAQTIAMTNAGKAGERATTKGLARLPGVLQTYHPDAVMLMYGANDLYGLGTAGIPTIAEAMRQMVVMVQGTGAHALLATLPAQREGALRAHNPEDIVPYNAALAAVALETGATLVDVYTAIGDPPPGTLIGVDGLHPTEAGYLKIAETFYGRIRATLEIAGVLTDGAIWEPLEDRILIDPETFASRARVISDRRRGR